MAQGTGKGKERRVEQKGNSRFNIQDCFQLSMISYQLPIINEERERVPGFSRRRHNRGGI
jgi:hypothetical protein